MRRAERHGGRIIGAHAHAQTRQIKRCRQFPEQRKMRARRVANRRQVEVIRKGFEGWARTSAITGETEPHYPEWRRSVKYVLTGVVMLMQV